jgi:hypothetical protein
MAFDRGEPPIHWIIHVDARGATSQVRIRVCLLFWVLRASCPLLTMKQALLQAR